MRIAAASVLSRRPLRGLSVRVARLTGPPTLHQLSQSGTLTGSLEEAGALLRFDVVPSDDPDFASVRAAVTERTDHARRGLFMQIEANTERLLFSAVRALRPHTVLEIGVADGRSSAVLLAALR